MAIEAATEAERLQRRGQGPTAPGAGGPVRWYDASLAERRYAACNSDNRLIAAQLEKAWGGRAAVCRDGGGSMECLRPMPAMLAPTSRDWPMISRRHRRRCGRVRQPRSELHSSWVCSRSLSNAFLHHHGKAIKSPAYVSRPAGHLDLRACRDRNHCPPAPARLADFLAAQWPDARISPHLSAVLPHRQQAQRYGRKTSSISIRTLRQDSLARLATPGVH